VSAKFRERKVAAELAAAGLRLAHWWTDRPGDFALSLSFV
jgi:L-histidine N-alpha-methyltransferase